jgi:hypothetical protein
MSVNGAELASGASTGDVSLAPGVNAIAVTVTPKTRTPRSYDVEVVRGTDALAGIQLSFGGASLFDPLDPAFDPGTLVYDVQVGHWLQSISLSATPLVAGTTVTISGNPVGAGVESPPFTLNAGLTTIDIAVKSGDGSTTHYQVRIYRATAGKQEAYAKGPLNLPYYLGGYGTAMYGDTVVATSINDSSAAVGVNGDPSDNSALHSGAAFVFVRDQKGWSQQAYLKASNTGREDQFGSAAAIWGDTIAISATSESSSATGVNGDQVNNATPYSGAVYVFRRSGATWAQEAYIKAPMANANGNFGAAVALSGDTLAVVNVSPLAVYIYRRSGSTWSYEKSISDDGDIALWGDTLAVFNGKSLNFYLRSAGEWTLQTSVTAPNPGSTYVSLAMAGETAVIGGEDGTGPAVWVYTRASSTWSLQQTLRAPSGTPSSATFGSAVTLWGDLLVVGAITDSSNATGLNGDQSDTSAMSSGAGFVFSRNTPIGSSKPLWYFRDYVKASNTAANADFSLQLAAWGDTFVISAPGERGVSTGVNGDQTTNPVGAVSGALYIFR